MNYLAHAWPLLAPDRSEEPALAWRIAGVAAPDWLSAVARRTRCRTRHALPWSDSPDPRVAALARGVVQHHRDDDWFHQTPAFLRLSVEASRRVRAAVGDGPGTRPWFVGHVLVELLLDAELHRGDPGRLGAYYSLLEGLDPTLVAGVLAAMIGPPNGRGAAAIAEFLPRFLEMRFLEDYADDRLLAKRLDQVLRRVGLPPLGAAILPVLAGLRGDIAREAPSLMPPDADHSDAGASSARGSADRASEQTAASRRA